MTDQSTVRAAAGRPTGTPLKVFGVRVLARSDWPTTDNQPRVVVASSSRAAAVRAIAAVGVAISDSFMKAYGSQTSNPIEVEAAMSQPGTVFVADSNHGARTFAAVSPRA